MFSQSLTQCIFHSALKRDVSVPILKSGGKSIPGNYRTISLTSCISKVFERIIKKQVLAFLERKGLLNNTQHGFRSDRSCMSALLNVFDNLTNMIDSNTTVDMIYLDFGITMSRNCSFDVHINILCKKCTDLSRWILRTFTSRDSTTLMTLFNASILSRLDYCSQLWSPHLIRHIIQIERFNVSLLNS